MTTLTREKPVLVVFWTLCKRKDYNEKRYRRIKCASEFEEGKKPQKAMEEIYQVNGRITDKTPAGNSPPLVYADVASHLVIHPHERGRIEEWKAEEQPLFDAITLQRCISHKRQPA